MFRVVGTGLQDIQQGIRAAKIGFVQEQRPILNVIGVQVLSLAKQDYVRKSRGDTGTDGIKWKRLAPSTITKRNRRGRENAKRKTTKSGKARPTGGQVAIGIDTGLQLNAATPGFLPGAGGGNIFVLRDTDVTVGFGRTYSKYYDEQRPLLPETLPKPWEAVIDKLVVRWALNLLRAKLGIIESNP